MSVLPTIIAGSHRNYGRSVLQLATNYDKKDKYVGKFTFFFQIICTFD